MKSHLSVVEQNFSGGGSCLGDNSDLLAGRGSDGSLDVRLANFLRECNAREREQTDEDGYEFHELNKKRSSKLMKG